MAEQLKRRLAAVLSADVKGYSRLMAQDDVATIRTLSVYRDIFAGIVVSNGGRIVDMPGDNILSEFGSAIDAVQAAVSIQAQLAERNSHLEESRRMEFRIGVNLGDVVVEGERIYGDGINIAARIEALAPAGGICVSGKVYEEVSRKLDIAFDDMGEHELHNIAAPVRVYRIGPGGAAATGPAAKGPPQAAAKPALLVLPFTNMSGDADQEFFADGLTEDIITELSRFHELLVISRNTAFKYKSGPVDIQKAARELAVQYVVEGSVRKAGNRVRVTVQLIDAQADRHVWAERYDRSLEDIFAIQDELTAAVAATLPGRVEAASRERSARKPTSTMAAYECVLAGKLLHHRSTRADNAEALRLIERAIELDSNYAHAHAWRACILGQAATSGWLADPSKAMRDIEQELAIAMALDENDSDLHRILSAINLTRNNHDKAIFHQQRALSLNPNDDLIVVQQGEVLTWLGQAEEGIEWIRKAMRLNPHHPARFWNHLGRAYFVAHRYTEAIEAFLRIGVLDHTHYISLAACQARLGNAAAAKEQMRLALEREPALTLTSYLPALHYKHEADLEHHRESLLMAGLPA